MTPGNTRQELLTDERFRLHSRMARPPSRRGFQLVSQLRQASSRSHSCRRCGDVLK